MRENDIIRESAKMRERGAGFIFSCNLALKASVKSKAHMVCIIISSRSQIELLKRPIKSTQLTSMQKKRTKKWIFRQIVSESKKKGWNQIWLLWASPSERGNEKREGAALESEARREQQQQQQQEVRMGFPAVAHIS